MTTKEAWITILIAIALSSSISLALFYYHKTTGKIYTIENILDLPGADGKEADRKNHYDAAVRLSEAAPFLELQDCNPKPLIMRVNWSDNLTVKNSGKDSIRIKIGEAGSFQEIPGGGAMRRDIKTIPRQNGVYGYYCGGKSSIVGLIYVALKQ